MRVYEHHRTTVEKLLYSVDVPWNGKDYIVHIYRHPAKKARCSHSAATVLGPGDTIISDGRSPEEVLNRQQTILPLALLSRSLL